MRTALAALCLAQALAEPAPADVLVAARTVRSQAILTAADVALVPGEPGDALDHPALAVGMEARVVLYAGRPIRPGDVGPPALVERNQIVALRYHHGRLRIATEGRALGRGGVGDRVRVMNLASRNTVTGRVLEDGTVAVGP